MTYLRNTIVGGQNKGQSYNNVPFDTLPPNLILKTASEGASTLSAQGHVTEVNLKGLPRGPVETMVHVGLGPSRKCV